MPRCRERRARARTRQALCRRRGDGRTPTPSLGGHQPRRHPPAGTRPPEGPSQECHAGSPGSRLVHLLRDATRPAAASTGDGTCPAAARVAHDPHRSLRRTPWPPQAAAPDGVRRRVGRRAGWGMAEPLVIEFREDERLPVVEEMEAMAAAGSGWLNVTPGLDMDMPPPPQSGLSRLLGSRGPTVPLGTWMPASGRDPSTVGIEHGEGRRSLAASPTSGRRCPTAGGSCRTIPSAASSSPFPPPRPPISSTRSSAGSCAPRRRSAPGRAPANGAPPATSRADPVRRRHRTTGCRRPGARGGSEGRRQPPGPGAGRMASSPRHGAHGHHARLAETRRAGDARPDSELADRWTGGHRWGSNHDGPAVTGQASWRNGRQPHDRGGRVGSGRGGRW